MHNKVFDFANSSNKYSDIGPKIVSAPFMIEANWVRDISLQILQVRTNLLDKLSWSSKLAELVIESL